MKYVNAADVLPKELLEELSKYVGGRLLYVPSLDKKSSWGEKTGSKKYYQERNQKIKELYRQGEKLEKLSKQFGLSYETIRKIANR